MNKYAQAIEWLKEFGEQSRMGLPDDVYYEYVEKLSYLIELVERATPKKVLKEQGEYQYTCICGTWNENIQNYCPTCGQHIYRKDGNKLSFNEDNLEQEIWEDIPNYVGHYQVSNLGRVRGVNRYVNNSIPNSIRMVKGKMLKLSKGRLGYYTVALCKNGIYFHNRVHRLVALAFMPNPENKPQINHINNNPSDNNIKNLEWCTPQENTAHSFKQGRTGKLSEEIHKEISQKYIDGYYQSQLARMYGISIPSIKKVLVKYNVYDKNKNRKRNGEYVKAT